MNTDRLRLLGLGLAALPLLAACEADKAGIASASSFGEANRQTNLAQVVDPEPEYEYLDPATSALHAAQAVERYRTDKVKKPDKVRSTESGGS